MIDENYANILGRRLFALGRHEQIAGKARLIVDLDQEIGQFHATHPLCQSGFEVSQTVFPSWSSFLVGSAVSRANCLLKREIVGLQARRGA